LKLSHYSLPRFRRSFLSLQTNFDIVYPIHEKAEDVAHPSDSNANLEKIPDGLLEVGDTVRVPPGATPPADGTIVSSDATNFDDVHVTRESRNVLKNTRGIIYLLGRSMSHGCESSSFLTKLIG